MVTHGVDAVFIPRVIRSRAKAEPIQCGCDLFVRELAGHFANHINGVETRTMAMFSSLTLLHAKYRMTATGPVNEQDSFAAIFIARLTRTSGFGSGNGSFGSSFRRSLRTSQDLPAVWNSPSTDMRLKRGELLSVQLTQLIFQVLYFLQC